MTERSSQIEVKVTFPISKKGPYETEFAADTAAGTVLEAAMQHFGVQDDSQFTYVLVHDGKEVDNTRSVGDIAGHAEEGKFTLVKKISQG